MNLFLQLVVISAIAVQSFGELLHCSKVMQEVCSKTDDYVSSISPDPLPTKVNVTLKFFEVIGVDEIAQTVTLSINANLYWNDYRLDVNRSKDYIERYTIS